MAEIAVSFLLNNLTIFIQQESSLLGGVREEAEWIRDELQRMKASLRRADAIEAIDPELQVWVKQVRDIARDTEDVLDEFMLRIVRYHGHGFYGYLRKISFTIKNLIARDRIASEISRIKSRVTQIADGHQRYTNKFAALERGQSSNTVHNTWEDRRNDALLLDEAELVGIQRPKNHLIGWLLENTPGLKVVSVAGMGGMGKTTLVKKVYDEMEVKNAFQSHAWIAVSESFDLRELLRNLIQQLFDEVKQPYPERMEGMDISVLKATLKRFLQQRRYVVVLDDVWTVNAWEALKYALPDNNCGSRILLTTRITSVASTSCGESHGDMYAMKALSPEESRILFCSKTFPKTNCPPHLEELSERILEKCEGLPLAIVAIGGVLATKDKSRVNEWEMILRSLSVELEGRDKLQSMYKILSLSYNDLPYYLKICFLYLSVFPEDYQIDRMRLIRLWSAEGFVEAREGMTIEEVAESYLTELLNRSLVQVAELRFDGRLKTCRIHDLFRDIITSKTREQSIAAIVTEANNTSSWPEKVRRLSIHYKLVKLQQTNDFSRLRSLLMFSVTEPLSKSSMPILFDGGVRLLKVLDLSGASLETFPNAVVKLIHLRYLSLRETKITTVPKSIGKLVNLEKLDLKQTYVTELPVQILKLQRLRHLLVYRYTIGEDCLHFLGVQGFKAIAGLKGLTSLQKLCSIEVDQEDSRIVVEELGSLTQLRRLGIVKLRRQDGKALCSSLEKLSNLCSLEIGSAEENEIIDIESLSSPPRSLQRLCLKGRLEKLPHWIPSLHGLTRLHLRWSKLMDEPLESLQSLPNLLDLELLEAYEGKELCFKAGMFHKLEKLVLESLKGMRSVTVEEGSMPLLETLQIGRCELMEVVSGIEHLTNLKYLVLSDMPEKLIMALDPCKQFEDYWKTEHFPRIFVAAVKDGKLRGYFLN